MDCSLPGSSVHGIFQAIVLEWIAISFSRGSSQPRDQTQVSCIVDRRFTLWATREVEVHIHLKTYINIKHFPGFIKSQQRKFAKKIKLWLHIKRWYFLCSREAIKFYTIVTINLNFRHGILLLQFFSGYVISWNNSPRLIYTLKFFFFFSVLKKNIFY